MTTAHVPHWLTLPTRVLGSWVDAVKSDIAVNVTTSRSTIERDRRDVIAAMDELHARATVVGAGR